MPEIMYGAALTAPAITIGGMGIVKPFSYA
jgi:hypothetical protein